MTDYSVDFPAEDATIQARFQFSASEPSFPRPHPPFKVRFTGHTQIQSGWHSRQMASTSSQVRTIEQSVCGTPRRGRQQQALSLDTQIRPRLWHSRQIASTLYDGTVGVSKCYSWEMLTL